MAVVRRHWAWVTAIPILILVAILALTQHGADSRRALAQVSQQPAVPVVQPTNSQSAAQAVAARQAYRLVQKLRVELALQNQDLATLGVTATTAQQIINALKTATATGDPLAALDQAKVAAAQNLAQAVRKMNVGPLDDSVLASLPTLRQNVVAVQAQRVGALAGLVGQINGLLTTDQQALWQAARDNAGRGLPAGFQYVTGITEDQRRHLDTAARHGGAPAVLSAAPKVLSGSQLSQLQSANSNRHTATASVAAAMAQALPVPAGFQRVTTQPAASH